MIYDTFMFRDEADLLECRLVELESVPDLVHVVIEADVTHGGNRPREFVYPDIRERFAPWADRIRYVQATNLPDDVDAWSREHAQREWAWQGVKDADPSDVVLHGDLDEIPTVLAVKWVRPRGFVVFEQRLHCFAVDWLHPEPWRGTVAGRVGDVVSWEGMRAARLTAQVIPDAGWHLSWLGGRQAAEEKMDSFCHPEVADMGWRDRLGECYETGLHVDGTKMVPVDVDESWPKWITAGRAPESWFRPR